VSCAAGGDDHQAKLDRRFARSTRDLLDIAECLDLAEAGLKSLAEPRADTTSPAGRIVLTFFAGFAEFERSLINEHTNSPAGPSRRRRAALSSPPCPVGQSARPARRLRERGRKRHEIAATPNVHVSTPPGRLQTRPAES
jgi:DNA invertase Pin-like site-specific DNA recombinase